MTQPIRFEAARAIEPEEIRRPGMWHVVSNPALLPLVRGEIACSACDQPLAMEPHITSPATGEAWHASCFIDGRIESGSPTLPGLGAA